MVRVAKKPFFLSLTALELVQSEEDMEYRIVGHLSRFVYARIFKEVFEDYLYHNCLSMEETNGL
jgi:hypothetical protein